MTRQTEVSARRAFWGFMLAVALAALTVSISALPTLFSWLTFGAVVATGSKFAAAIVRLPQGSRTLWSLVGTWGLLVAVLSLTL